MEATDPFQFHDKEFAAVTGDAPRLVKVVDTDAHEGRLLMCEQGTHEQRARTRAVRTAAGRPHLEGLREEGETLAAGGLGRPIGGGTDFPNRGQPADEGRVEQLAEGVVVEEAGAVDEGPGHRGRRDAIDGGQVTGVQRMPRAVDGAACEADLERLAAADGTMLLRGELVSQLIGCSVLRHGLGVWLSAPGGALKFRVREVGDMARIRWIDEGEATGELAELYGKIGPQSPMGVVPDIIKTMSLRPDFLRAIASAARLHFTDGALTRAQHEMIASYVSALNRCHY